MACYQPVVVMMMVMVAVVQGAGDFLSSHDDFLNTYSSVKVNFGCYPPKEVKGWFKRVEKALHECEEQSLHSEVVQSGVQRLGSAAPHVIIIPADWSKIVGQFFSPTYRQKRGASFSAEKIRSLRAKLEAKVRTFRCAMQKMGVTDTNNQLSPETYLTNFQNLGLQPSLLRNNVKGIKECHQLATCMLSKGSSDLPVPIDVIQTKTFLECEKKRRHMACLQEDLKPQVAEGAFDLAAAGEWLRDIPTDEGKAAALLWADQIVGNEDYGLIE